MRPLLQFIFVLFTLCYSKRAYTQIVILQSEDFIFHYAAEDSVTIRSVDSLFSVSLVQLQEELNYYTNRPVDVFFTSKHPDAQLSNPLDHREGVVPLSPKCVKISMDEDLQTLRYSIRSQIAQLLVEEMLLGGSIQDKIKSANLVNLPSWVLPGLYHYLGSEWSIYDDNSWRSVYENYGFRNFNSIPTSFDDIKGASFWKFIEHQYGSSAIPSLLYMMRLTRKLNAALFYAFEISMRDVSEDWQEHYIKIYQQDQHRLSPLDGIRIPTGRAQAIVVVNDTLFYTLEKTFWGYSLCEYSGSTFNKVVKYKTSGFIQIVPHSLSASSRQLQWVIKEANAYFHLSLNLTSNEVAQKKIDVDFPISQVTITSDGLYLLSSGWDTSQIYLYTSSVKRVFQVRGFVSSFDVSSGFIVATVQFQNQFEVWTKKPQLTPSLVASTAYQINDVVIADDSTVLVNTASNGILNGKVLNLKTGHFKNVTNYRYNISFHQFDHQVFAEYLHKGEYSELYITDNLPVDELYIYDTLYPTYSLLYDKKKETINPKEIQERHPDSLQSYTFQSPVSPQLDYASLVIPSFLPKAKDELMQKPWEESAQMFFSKAYLRLTNTGDFISQSKFKESIPLQSPSRLNLDIGFTFANKQNSRNLALGLSGLLQNGALDVYASYSQQKKWLAEYGIINRRRVRFTATDRSRFLTTVGQVSFTRPLFIPGFSISHIYRVRHDQKSNLITNAEALPQLGSREQSVIFSQLFMASFHKVWSGQMLQSKFSFGPNISSTDKGYNLNTDFSAFYSYRLKPQLLFKSRGQIVNSFGTSPIYYTIGGAETDASLAFFQQTFATYKAPMLFHSLFGIRGFPLNYRNGNTAMYTNLQLDWKVLEHIFQKPITSEFMSNITLRSFADLGTSFYGRHIFDRVNVLGQNTIATETGSVIVRTNANKNPFIGSVGLGVGSKIFGYSISLDAALGYESQVINPTMYHINIGHHF